MAFLVIIYNIIILGLQKYIRKEMQWTFLILNNTRRIRLIHDKRKSKLCVVRFKSQIEGSSL